MRNIYNSALLSCMTVIFLIAVVICSGVKGVDSIAYANEPIPIETTAQQQGWYESQYEISIDHLPYKIDYALGEKLDLTGLRVSLVLYDQHGIKNIIFDNVDPMEYTDAFTIDSSNFDNMKIGVYSIIIKTTDLYKAFLDTELQQISINVDQNYIKGDINNDGYLGVADIVMLNKWLLAVPNVHLNNWKAADYYNDNRLDVFDLCLMKRALFASNQTNTE